ncbi:MAG: hypothetical protein O3C49_07280 [Proteobacteria bacterium]|nr:hypothetical protein [Pseudomonadota bacterium]
MRKAIRVTLKGTISAGILAVLGFTVFGAPVPWQPVVSTYAAAFEAWLYAVGVKFPVLLAFVVGSLFAVGYFSLKRWWRWVWRDRHIWTLWKLREIGVAHRNAALQSTAEYPKWVEEMERWRGMVLNHAEGLSHEFAAYLRTLDQVRPPPSLPPAISPDHDLRRRNMSEILVRMQEVLARQTGLLD